MRLAYDDMRRLTSVAAGDASWLGRYEYDVNNFITKLDQGTLCATDSTFAYDADTNALTRGVLGYMVDASSRLSKHTLSYDRLGRATEHYFGSDAAGNTHRMRWQYSYDDSNAGRLTAIASSNDDGLSSGETTYAYDDHGRLTRLALRNGADTTYAYDRGGRLTRLANAHTSGYLGVSFDYEYDANANMTRIAQDFNGVDVAHEYAYDELNRLTREKTCDYDDAYSYDDVGNRTALTRVAGGVTKATAYSHNAAHELTQLVYSEDAAAQYTKTYGYDAAGRTTRVTKQGGGLTTVVHTYDWDAADRLTRAQVDTGENVKTIEYGYDAAGLRVRRVDASTNVTKLYSYQGHNIASIQKSQNGGYTANEWVYTVAPGMISNALERHQVSAGGGSTTSQYYQYDHRGNVVAVTDWTGDIQYGYQYDAFGNITFSFDEGGATGPTDDILFTGKDYDADTGLYYFNARWYDPATGIFISRAYEYPVVEHPYVLCQGNSLGTVDPGGTGGMFWLTPVLIGFGLLYLPVQLIVRSEVELRRACWLCGCGPQPNVLAYKAVDWLPGGYEKEDDWGTDEWWSKMNNYQQDDYCCMICERCRRGKSDKYKDKYKFRPASREWKRDHPDWPGYDVSMYGHEM